MNLGAETRWLLLLVPPFLFPINHSGNKESVTSAATSRLSISTHPGSTPRATSSFNNSYAALAQPPSPSPLIPSSDSALTHLPSLHPGRLDAGLLLVGLTGRGLCSSRALMGRINWVSFQLNVAECLNELWIHRKTHTLQKTGNFHL